MHAHDRSRTQHISFLIDCLVICVKMFSLLTKKVTYVVKSLEEIAMSKIEGNRATLCEILPETSNMGRKNRSKCPDGNNDGVRLGEPHSVPRDDSFHR